MQSSPKSQDPTHPGIPPHLWTPPSQGGTRPPSRKHASSPKTSHCSADAADICESNLPKGHAACSRRHASPRRERRDLSAHRLLGRRLRPGENATWSEREASDLKMLTCPSCSRASHAPASAGVAWIVADRPQVVRVH